MLPLDHCDLQGHVGVNSLPKVVTRQRRGWEFLLATIELLVQRPKGSDTLESFLSKVAFGRNLACVS